MTGLKAALCAIGLVAAAAMAPLPAAADAEMTGAQREAIEKVVRDYLLRNPQVVVEAIERLREQKRLADAAADRETVVANRAEIFRDPDSPVGGNPDGDVTVVEFFDYRCGVCKRVHPIVDELIRSDSKIRRVYKEWPILGPESVIAARAAIAARKQDKYLAMHDALMEFQGDLNEGNLFRVAAAVGLDVRRLQRDMADPAVEAHMRRNYVLADKLRLNGTPSFLIGDEIIRGGRDLESMRQIVAEIRKRGK